ncbi:MAG: cupin domain-containing protein [Chitinophagaceae bacterium]|mgnify:CR=1 FL=1|nr:cupin domain-containing protein [Chitinophagaceae bacterium]
MEEKYNISTDQRPEGERVLDAPMVQIDIPGFVEQIKSEPAWKTSDRNAITVFKTDGLRIVLVALHKEAVLSEHSAAGILSLHVLEGEIKFESQNKSVNLRQGHMVTLHKGLAHAVTAIEESVFILSLSTSASR